jgi:hypothetical protein
MRTRPAPKELTDTNLDGEESPSRRWGRALFALLGLSIGLAILVAKILVTEAPPHSFKTVAPKLVEHIGVGFIVAALAVIGYEWGSEVKAALNLSHTALTLSNKLQMVLAASSNKALERGAKALLKADTRRFGGLVSSIELVSDLRQDKSWDVPAYLRFLTASVHATHSIFASVSTLISEKPDLPHEFRSKSVLTFQRPDELIDELMAGLLDGLGSGDEYYAVSNARIWETLKRFHSAHTAAVERGVKIRRVFLLFDESDLVLSPSTTIEIIYEHFKETQRLKPEHGYELKLVDRDAYHSLAPILEQHVHFGVFKPVDGNAIEVAAVTADLSHLELSRALTDESFESFESLWRNLPSHDDAEMRFTLRAERMRKLLPGGRYRGISRIRDWKQVRLRRFQDVTLARLRSTAIAVDRIFVYDDAEEGLCRFLADHQRVASGGLTGAYRWKFHASTRESPTIPTTVLDHLPFGTFDEGKAETGQTLSELYSGDHPFVFTRDTSNVINSAFDDLWQQLDTRVELGRVLRPEQVDALLSPTVS